MSQLLGADILISELLDPDIQLLSYIQVYNKGKCTVM